MLIVKTGMQLILGEHVGIFGMRGAGNLKWFTIFSFKNAPKKYLLQYWVMGIIRRVGGYLLDWINGK